MRESGYYPPGAEFDPNAPWNQEETPEMDFNVTIQQCLSKSVVVTTNNYVRTITKEMDDMGGFVEDFIDTDNTDWSDAYHDSDHYTPLQLIGRFKDFLTLELQRMPEVKNKAYYEHLIEECDNWIVDEEIIMKDE